MWVHVEAVPSEVRVSSCELDQRQTWTAADIEDDLVLEEVGVVVDGIAVALGADLIFLRWLLGLGAIVAPGGLY